MGCRRAHQHSEDEDDAASRDREGDGPLAERQVKRLAALRSRFLPVVLQFGSLSRPHRGTMGRQALTFGFACRFGFQIGRASGRERVCHYVSIWVVAVSLQYKKQSIARNLLLE